MFVTGCHHYLVHPCVMLFVTSLHHYWVHSCVMLFVIASHHFSVHPCVDMCVTACHHYLVHHCVMLFVTSLHHYWVHSCVMLFVTASHHYSVHPCPILVTISPPVKWAALVPLSALRCPLCCLYGLGAASSNYRSRKIGAVIREYIFLLPQHDKIVLGPSREKKCLKTQLLCLHFCPWTIKMHIKLTVAKENIICG